MVFVWFGCFVAGFLLGWFIGRGEYVFVFCFGVLLLLLLFLEGVVCFGIVVYLFF